MLKELGQRIKELRKNYGFTQKQIAEYLDMSQGQVAKLETGKRRINKSDVKKLADLYGVPERYIIDGREDIPLKRIRMYKGANPKDIVGMNKIIGNIEFLAEITKGIMEN